MKSMTLLLQSAVIGVCLLGITGCKVLSQPTVSFDHQADCGTFYIGKTCADTARGNS
jgi:hypothetical protein